MAAEVSKDGQSLLCTSCGTEIQRVYAPTLHPETRTARELLERWRREDLVTDDVVTPDERDVAIEDLSQTMARLERLTDPATVNPAHTHDPPAAPKPPSTPRPATGATASAGTPTPLKADRPAAKKAAAEPAAASDAETARRAERPATSARSHAPRRVSSWRIDQAHRDLAADSQSADAAGTSQTEGPASVEPGQQTGRGVPVSHGPRGPLSPPRATSTHSAPATGGDSDSATASTSRPAHGRDTGRPMSTAARGASSNAPGNEPTAAGGPAAAPADRGNARRGASGIARGGSGHGGGADSFSSDRDRPSGAQRRRDSAHARQRAPHFDMQAFLDAAPVKPGRQETAWGQLLAYLGVAVLTIGVTVAMWGYFKMLPSHTSTGFLIATAGQMLLFLGIVTLISGGMTQTSHEVGMRVEFLGERMLRFERSTKKILRGPHFGKASTTTRRSQTATVDDASVDEA